MTKKLQYLTFFLMIVFFAASSCKDSRRRNSTIKLVSEWTGKEILLPENARCYTAGKDTLPEICSENFQKEFKILMYVDSAGCSDCRLKLPEWNI